MDDKTTNIQTIKDMVATFVKERDWGQFHNPKNLSMSIAIEASELMEIFQWSSFVDAWDICDSDEFTHVKEAEIYLASPLSVAQAAIKGVI